MLFWHQVHFVSDPVASISLGLALMLGTAGLPHILMRDSLQLEMQKKLENLLFMQLVLLVYFYLLIAVVGLGELFT